MERPATRWERFRMGCYNFFDAHDMPGLAKRFEATPELHYIPSTELKNKLECVPRAPQTSHR